MPNVAAREVGLYRRVERQVPKLARQMIDRFIAEIPLYALLPREQVEGEILAITDRNLRLFFAALRENRSLTDGELTDVRMSAARRAEERVPLEALLTAYHVGGRIGWEALVAAAGPDDMDDLVAAAAQVLEYVQQVSAAVASAYLEERQSIYGEERDAVHALTSELLAGRPSESLAARVGISIASAYAVLAVRLLPHPDESESGVGGAVAARRKLHRVQQALAVALGVPVLGLLEPSGGAVLLPADQPVDLTELVTGLAAAAGANVVCGVADPTGPEDLPHAAGQARDVLELACTLEQPSGAYRLTDLLLEYQLSRPSAALPFLASLLDPLDRNPDLVRTLQVYLARDLDRRSTAAQLHVHPNTLDYRLRRIVELTELDPSTTRGLQLLAAALAARQLTA
jgi:hypothetical protein